MLHRLSSYSPQALAVLRIVTALLFFMHGTQKLLGFPPMPMETPPEMAMLMTIAGVLEFFGGFALLIGLFTRPVAFVLSGQMAVAYWMGHAPMALFPTVNYGDAAILFCFIFLYLVFAGPGAWSVDEVLARRRPATA